MLTAKKDGDRNQSLADSDSSDGEKKPRLNQFMREVAPYVIHRSKNRIMMAESHTKKDKFKDKVGWRSPMVGPYQPLGTFQKVVPIMEEMKIQIQHSTEMSTETQKNINKHKKNPNSIYKGANQPQRTWKIIASGLKDLHINLDKLSQRPKYSFKNKGYKIPPRQQFINLQDVAEQDKDPLSKRMQNLESSFMRISINEMDENFEQDKLLSESSHEDEQEAVNFNNQRLMTPSMKNISARQDAAQILKEEIGESTLRMKAAKFGRGIEDLAPHYPNSFFLPDRLKYQTPLEREQKIFKLSKGNQGKKGEQPNLNQDYSSNIFMTSVRSQTPVLKMPDIKSNLGRVLDAKNNSHRESTLNRSQVQPLTLKTYTEPQKVDLRLDNLRISTKMVTQKMNGKSLDFKGEASVKLRKANESIQKLLPRKPERLNEIRQKFETAQKQKLPRDNDFGIFGHNSILSTRNHYESQQSYSSQVSLERSSVRFISTLDNKPINPPFLTLLSLEAYIQQLKQQKNQPSLKEKISLNKNLSFEKTEFDDIIRTKGKGLLKLLDGDLKTRIREYVEIPHENYKRQKLEEKRIQAIISGNVLEAAQKSEAFEFESPKSEAPQARAPSLRLSPQKRQNSELIENPQNLTQLQERLLNKLIEFKSLKLEGDNEQIKKKLYDLFFEWRVKGPSDEFIFVDEQDALKNWEDKAQAQADEEVRRESKKREQLQKEQDLQDFKSRGGFIYVLNKIFNPKDAASVQLDSVYQLKQICKEFYQRKNAMSDNLIDALDAINNERPRVLSLKKSNLTVEDTISSKQESSLKWMRLKTERDRVKSFMAIARDSAWLYYSIIEKYAVILEDMYKSSKVQHLLDEGLQESDTQYIVRKNMMDQLLKITMNYITDFMRQVIENGQKFTQNHLFLMLLHLKIQEIQNDSPNFLRPLFADLKVTREEYKKFTASIIDPNLRQAYESIEDKIFYKDYAFQN